MLIGIDATALPEKPSGAGIYIQQLIRALAALDYPAGFDPQYLVFARPSAPELIGAPPSPRLRYELIPDLPPWRRLLWEQTVLPGLARRTGIDLLHSLHYTRPWRLPCPSLVTLHDLTFFLFPHLHTLPKRYFFRLMIHYSARTAAGLLAVSESTRQDAIRLLGLAPQRIQATPLGVDPEFRPVTDPAQRAAVRQRYQLPESFILYVGVLEPRKNLPALLQAFRQAVDRGLPHQLVIAGKMGWMTEQFFELLDQLELRSRVHLTGYVAPADLPVVYNLAQVFVYPSIYEGFGLPVLEAMACGTPVITSNISSMPEIAGVAGLLLPPGDVPALADALLGLLGDPAERRRRSALGLQRAAEFTWQRTARLTAQVYQELLQPA